MRQTKSTRKLLEGSNSKGINHKNTLAYKSTNLYSLIKLLIKINAKISLKKLKRYNLYKFTYFNSD